MYKINLFFFILNFRSWRNEKADGRNNGGKSKRIRRNEEVLWRKNERHTSRYSGLFYIKKWTKAVTCWLDKKEEEYVSNKYR